MLKVLPHRWWVVLACTLVGAAFGFVFPLGAARRVFSHSGVSVEPSVNDLASAAAVGAVVGLGAALLILLWFAARDTPLIAAQCANPGAEVLQALTAAGAAAALLGGADQRLPANVRSQTWFPIVFDRAGMHVWAGGAYAEEVAFVPWSSISEVVLGERGTVGGGRYSYVVDRLAVSVLVDGQLTLLQVGVEHLPRVFSTQGFSTAQEILLLAQRINDLRDGIVRVRPGERRAPLIPGATAWNASQLSLLFAVIAGIACTLIIATSLLLATTVSVEVALWALTPIAPIVGVAAIATLMSRRVVKRELAAGYTTLNGKHLDREQRHPRFGHVIRRPGQPALGQREFFALLRTADGSR